MKTLVYPILDLSKSVVYTESPNVLWTNVQTKKNRLFSNDAFFSDYANLKREKVQAVSRSCEVLDEITVE